MKRIIFLFISVFFISVSSFASNDTRFDKANELFQNQKYSEAITTYEEILSSGMESGEVYFNLGNAYYKAGNLPKAILNYERAKLILPHDKDIAYNLQMVNSQITDKLETVGEFFLISWFKNFRNTTKSDTWAIISIVTFALGLLLLAIFMFTRSKSIKQIAFFSAIILILVCITSISFSAKQKNMLTKRNSAIIFEPSVTIKSSPSVSGTELFILHEGTKVKVLESVSDWYRIQISDGNDGWLPSSTVEII